MSLFWLSRLLHTETKAAQLFTYCTITPVRIDYGLCFFQRKTPVLIHILLISQNGNHFCQKNCVTAQIHFLLHTAFDRHRSLTDHTTVNPARRYFGQVHGLKFIQLTPGADSAEIRRTEEADGCQIDRKYPGLIQIRIAQAAFSK